MKKYVKSALFYILLAGSLIFLTALENLTISPFVYVRISLTMCICLCLVLPQLSSVVICAFCGFLADIYSLSLPTFALLYLYISSGCVWSVRLFVSFSKKAVLLTCFFALLGFCVIGFLMDFLLYESFSINLKTFFQWIVFSLINAVPSPIIYSILKRAQY